MIRELIVRIVMVIASFLILFYLKELLFYTVFWVPWLEAILAEVPIPVKLPLVSYTIYLEPRFTAMEKFVGFIVTLMMLGTVFLYISLLNLVDYVQQKILKHMEENSHV